MPHILWNSDFHHRSHNSPPQAFILYQMNPEHALPSYSLRSISVPLPYTVRLGLRNSFFTLGFPHMCYSSSSLIWSPNNISWAVPNMKLLNMQSPPVYCHFFLSDRSIITALFSSTLNLCSPAPSTYLLAMTEGIRVHSRTKYRSAKTVLFYCMDASVPNM